MKFSEAVAQAQVENAKAGGGLCDQCGKPFHELPCGPTHATIAANYTFLQRHFFHTPDETALFAAAKLIAGGAARVRFITTVEAGVLTTVVEEVKADGSKQEG